MIRFPQVGDTFGRYRIVGQLGRGSMGVVFDAVQIDLDRQVALKILGPDVIDDDAFRERFIREAGLLARANSPHIIQIYEHGELDGCLFMATQRVTSGDLRAWLDQNGGCPPEQALDLIGQVASALVDAHGAGVIHRDIKPSNVLLHVSGHGTPFAYLCDFGIAQQSHERTQSAGVLGTYGYLAPERHSGVPASESSDVYSVGCLLWATLSGSAPYEGTDMQVAIAHLQAPLPTIPGQDPLTQRINQILQRSMAKQPADRYASARELLDAVESAKQVAAQRPVDLAGAAAAWGVAQAQPAFPPPVAEPTVGPGVGGFAWTQDRGTNSSTQASDFENRRRPRHKSAWIAALVATLALVGIAGGVWATTNDPGCPAGSTKSSEGGCVSAATQANARSQASKRQAHKPTHPRQIQCPDGSTVSTQERCQTTSDTPSALPSEPSTAPTTAAPTPTEQETTGVDPVTSLVRCWNGTVTSTKADCSLPSGVEGLEWVFPSFKSAYAKGLCEQESVLGRSDKNSSWFCYLNYNTTDGVRYRQWGSVELAREHVSEVVPGVSPISRVIMGHSPVYQWDKPGGLPPYQRWDLYQQWPYSASMVASSREGLETAADRVVYRWSDDIPGITQR